VFACNVFEINGTQLKGVGILSSLIF